MKKYIAEVKYATTIHSNNKHKPKVTYYNTKNKRLYVRANQTLKEVYNKTFPQGHIQRKIKLIHTTHG